MSRSKRKFSNPIHSNKVRRAAPKVKRNKKGDVEGVFCPFCAEEHALSVGEPSHCGTFLEIAAVQTTFSGSALECVRCGETGGTLVKMGESKYVHSYMCKPKNVYMTPPKPSFSARLAWMLPDKAMVRVAQWFKKYPEQLVALDEEGKATDQIVGYHWKAI